jgi:hypothetical protein
VVWGQRLALAGGVLILAPWSANVYTAPKALAASAGIAAAWLGLKSARRTALGYPVLALLACAGLSTAFSLDPFQSLWGDSFQPYYGVLQFSLYAAAYWLGASVDDKTADDGLSTLALAGGLAAAFAAAQAVGLVPHPWDATPGTRRVLGPTGNPAMFGAVAVMLLPACLWRWKARSSRAAGLAAAGLGVALLLTQSRMAWLAAGGGAFVWLAASGRLTPRSRRLGTGLLLALVLAAGVFTLRRSRVDSMRVGVWRAAAVGALERPWTGYGPDNYMLALRKLRKPEFVAITRHAQASQSSAHNDLLQAAATLGLPGFLAYLWLIGALTAHLWRSLQGEERERAAAAAGALAAVFLAAKFNPVPPEGCVVAAWLAGACGPRREPLGGWRRPALAALACAVLAGYGLLAGAEAALGASRKALTSGRFQEAAALAARAASLAPGRLPQEVGLCSALIQLGEADPGRVRALASEALDVGRRAAQRHPGNPMAREAAGTAAFFAGLRLDRNLLHEALAELKAASDRDPLHPYAIRRRIEVARAMGDAGELGRAEEDLRRVRQYCD